MKEKEVEEDLFSQYIDIEISINKEYDTTPLIVLISFSIIFIFFSFILYPEIHKSSDLLYYQNLSVVSSDESSFIIMKSALEFKDYIYSISRVCFYIFTILGNIFLFFFILEICGIKVKKAEFKNYKKNQNKKKESLKNYFLTLEGLEYLLYYKNKDALHNNENIKYKEIYENLIRESFEFNKTNFKNNNDNYLVISND